MRETEVELMFPTPELALKACLALRPEEAFKGKSSARISTKGRALLLRVKAKDTPSLRASLNSLLRLTMVVRDMMELREE